MLNVSHSIVPKVRYELTYSGDRMNLGKCVTMLIADEAMFQNRSEDAVRYGRADASVSQIARSVELQQLQKQLVLQI